MRAIIAGYGFLGSRIGALLMTAGYAVTVIKRTGMHNVAGINCVICDLTVKSPQLVENKFDVAIFCLAPGSREPELYKRIYCEAQNNFLAGVQTERYLYVSSTGVYPEAPGQYAEESAIAHSGRASTLLEAESMALQHPHACVLRLAGIYSSERRIYDAGGATYPDDKLVHFIHADDAAKAVLHALGNRLTGAYNVHDGNPQWRSAILKVLSPNYVAPGSNGSRTISAEKFFKTGFNPTYANYFAGIDVL